MKIIVLLPLVAILTGCLQSHQPVSTIPMIQGELKHFGMPPWQLVNYDNEKLLHGAMVVVDNELVKEEKTVYINEKSQFTYKDGTRITSGSGNYLYWNNNGQIITKNLKVIPKDMVFSVAGRPMRSNEPIKLKNK